MQPSRSTQEGPSPRLLPPIDVNGDAATCTVELSPVHRKSPFHLASEHKLWSRFHTGCAARDTSCNRTPVTIKKKKSPSHCREKPSKSSTENCLEYFKNSTEVNVANYLDQNKDFLETYVMQRISSNELERWKAKKFKKNLVNGSPREPHFRRTTSSSRYCKKQIFMDLVQSLNNDLSIDNTLWELIKSVTAAVDVDIYRVYKVFSEESNLVQCLLTKSRKVPEAISPGLKHGTQEKNHLVTEAAKSGTSLRLSKISDPLRFPKTPQSLFKALKMNNVTEANHVMYQPILTATGKVTYVIEMWRIDKEFKQRDEEVGSYFLVWGSLALHCTNLYLDKSRERNMSDFLLDVVKAIFEEMVSLDQLIKRILEFAQRLVNADRASLFLVDYRNFELVSTVFDLKFDPDNGGDVEKKEIRMPINRGIAGHVALSGETMNIPDAYSDYRFNRAVDEATGYKTVNILCMPIKVQGKVIGVVQMVNKRNLDSFDRNDEVNFETFSTFFGLALHHARLYDRIIRKEQKYRVALEVLSYHNTCRESEVNEILNHNNPLTVNLDDFYMDPYKLDVVEKCKAVLSMFNDLFDISKFDIMTVTRFILTVKKNYRTVPYHNFDHGWSVANAMYVLLKNDLRRRFDYKMRLSLFVACLCHDLDHRGYTNKYMSETASPLAAMYTTSTLEHHHFNITVTILQQDGHNIFSHMTSREYKEILGLIKHCILATDLAAFFPNLEKMKNLHIEDSPVQIFSWEILSHRELAMAISMTAADLSASAKPWNVQIKTVKVIFEEFYDQGDKERAAGRVPIPMMDRSKPKEQPASQVGFLSQICIPCYDMLFKILPGSKPMYIMALRNLQKWKSRANRIVEEERKKSQEDKEIEEIFRNFDREDNDSVGELADMTTEININNGNKKTDIATKKEERVRVKIITGPQHYSHTAKLWEDAEGDIEGEERARSVMWEKIDGEKWIEEEGVVIGSTKSSLGFKSKKYEREKKH